MLASRVLAALVAVRAVVGALAAVFAIWLSALGTAVVACGVRALAGMLLIVEALAGVLLAFGALVAIAGALFARARGSACGPAFEGSASVAASCLRAGVLAGLKGLNYIA